MSAAPGANDADGVLVGGGDFSFDVEEERGVRAFGKLAGPKRGLGGEDGDAVAVAEGDFGVGVGELAPIADDGGDLGADSGDGLQGSDGLSEDGLGISEFGEKTADADGADFGEGVEAEEGGEHGWDWGGYFLPSEELFGKGALFAIGVVSKAEVLVELQECLLLPGLFEERGPFGTIAKEPVGYTLNAL